MYINNQLYLNFVYQNKISQKIFSDSTALSHFGHSLAVFGSQPSSPPPGHVITKQSLTQSAKMLGAAGRAAGGLVKQAVKAGNVQQILPAASIGRK